jgi:sugar O-acyltransferase (sialic acid O-acetyltransferase NeuD family)
LSAAKPIVIYGAGGLGREIFAAAIRSGLTVSGFIDDGLPPGTLISDIPVLGGFTWLKENPVSFLPAFGDSLLKQKITEKVLSETASVLAAPLIDPAAKILDPSRFEIGAGSIITAGAVLTTSIRIGKCVIINLNCSVGHDCEIGDYTSVMPGVNIAGNVKIGRSVFIGTGAIILGGITIGDGVMVGAGSVVNHSVGEGKRVVGVPARELRGIA